MIWSHSQINTIFKVKLRILICRNLRGACREDLSRSCSQWHVYRHCTEESHRGTKFQHVPETGAQLYPIMWFLNHGKQAYVLNNRTLGRNVAYFDQSRFPVVPSLRMRGAVPPLPEYDFMAWCLVKHRNNVSLPPVCITKDQHPKIIIEVEFKFRNL
jgi:hypothetical protein